MRLFLTSLISVIVLSVVGVGWAVSQLYVIVSDRESLEQTDAIASFEMLAGKVAFYLDSLPDQQSFVTTWNADDKAAISLTPAAEFPVPVELSHTFLQGQPLLLESADRLTLSYYLQNSDRVMTMTLPKGSGQDASIQNLTLTMVFYLGLVLVILVWAYPLIVRMVRLGSATAEFGRGNLTTRIATGKLSYIAQIEREFNRMADRIEALIKDNKLLSGAVSHNLKTPISRLRFGLDVLREGNVDDRDSYLQRMDHDLNDMESLVEALLQYARLDSATIELDIEDVDLGEFCAELVSDARSDAIDVTIDQPAGQVCVVADRRYLAMQLNNVLANAFTHANSQIIVSICRKEDLVECWIEDDGAGVHKEEYQQVLEPFARGKAAQGKGHGLGLAIAARIARWQGGEIRISRSEVLGGAAVCLSFPER